MIKHKEDCKMAFGRKDKTCPRCQELLNGSPVRTGWQAGYFSRKKQEQESRSREIREHNCKKSGCGPVCTAFEW